MTLYIFISIDMNPAFCHVYDKDIYIYTHTTRIHTLQDHFPLECHLEQSCGGDLLYLDLTPTNNFAPRSL